ncbi:MAG: hypothetical protein ACFFCM_05890 [Promethearchaeota archaeon]
MGEIELFKGALTGSVTSFSLFDAGLHFSIKLNEEIEGLPKEFLISFIVFSRSSFRYRITFLRKGDIVTIGGTVIQFFKREEQLENIVMKANYVYNTTLKHGVGLKVKRKEIFRGSLSGTATSDEIISQSKLGLVFSMKLDLEIEGIPNEFLVYKFPSQLRTIIRKGDKLVIEGKLFQGNMGKNGFQINEMEAKHIYNKTLKCGR